MLLKKKELELIWVFYYISVICAGTYLEYLNAHKDNEKDDVFIFGIVIILFYILIAAILQFFFMSCEPTPVDIELLWFIFTLIMSLCAMTPEATDERLETLHYFGCGFIQLYIIYLYEAFKGQPYEKTIKNCKKDSFYERSYLKRIFLRAKRLGRVGPRDYRPYG